VLGWATGNLAEPRNNPQVGMANMRGILPALQKAKPASLPANGLHYLSLGLPKKQRTTRVVKDMPEKAIANELLAWLREE
jgi:electron transfer flavoprotein beta subunit